MSPQHLNAHSHCFALLGNSLRAIKLPILDYLYYFQHNDATLTGNTGLD